MVRVEEELKHQREPMREGFNAMEKRFEAMDKHFERLEQRLDHFMRWSFGSLVAVGSSIIAVLKLWT